MVDEGGAIKTELLIGCGNSRDKRMSKQGDPPGWSNLTTLDFSADCGPDVVHDLEVLPYPFADNSFDEIHAYEVLEHTGQQGDWRFFFAQFGEFYRILKPNGCMFITVPTWNSVWAWGDPSHKRVLSLASVTFLSQVEYTKQIGKTSMSDYRETWKGDFQPVYHEIIEDTTKIVLVAANK